MYPLHPCIFLPLTIILYYTNEYYSICLQMSILEDDYFSGSNDTYFYENQDYILDEYGEVICEGATEDERVSYSEFAWWVEGIGQMTVGGIGFLANCVAIPILCSKEMSSIFNRLLTCLAIFDNTYLICGLVEGVRRHFITSQVQSQSSKSEKKL